ncbi:MAG TPA: GFA family protein [Croceibacterium sp.]
MAFELAEPPTMMGTCHCSRCRKSGAGTMVFVRGEAFRWLRGEELLARHAAAPPYKYDRCFCSRCGTALGEPGAGASFPLNAQCLDDDPQVRVAFHEFVADKPAWYAICDDAPRFEGHPPAPG